MSAQSAVLMLLADQHAPLLISWRILICSILGEHLYDAVSRGSGHPPSSMLEQVGQ
jgi:hypothetical protein